MNIEEIKISQYALKELKSISKKLHKIDENDCNGYQDYQGNWDEAAEKRAERRAERLERRAEEIAQGLGLHIYHQGDPRGGTLYLVTDEIQKSGQYTQGFFIW